MAAVRTHGGVRFRLASSAHRTSPGTDTSTMFIVDDSASRQWRIRSSPSRQAPARSPCSSFISDTSIDHAFASHWRRDLLEIGDPFRIWRWTATCEVFAAVIHLYFAQHAFDWFKVVRGQADLVGAGIAFSPQALRPAASQPQAEGVRGTQSGPACQRRLIGRCHRSMTATQQSR